MPNSPCRDYNSIPGEHLDAWIQENKARRQIACEQLSFNRQLYQDLEFLKHLLEQEMEILKTEEVEKNRRIPVDQLPRAPSSQTFPASSLRRPLIAYSEVVKILKLK